MMDVEAKNSPASPLPAANMAVLDPHTKIRHDITASLRANNDLIYRFATAWYASPYTFQSTKVLGVSACKIPFDLWIYHDLFCQFRFQTVVETGTASGGSALWYATLMDLLKIDDGLIYTIDTEAAPDRPTHPRIIYLNGSSTDPSMLDRVTLQGPLLVSLDSNHLAYHVLAELALWAPLVPVGSWLVVEDTNGAPVVKDAQGVLQQVEGPFAAVSEYLQAHPGEFVADTVCERYWLTMNPNGWLQRVALCH